MGRAAIYDPDAAPWAWVLDTPEAGAFTEAEGDPLDAGGALTEEAKKAIEDAYKEAVKAAVEQMFKREASVYRLTTKQLTTYRNLLEQARKDTIEALSRATKEWLVRDRTAVLDGLRDALQRVNATASSTLQLAQQDAWDIGSESGVTVSTAPRLDPRVIQQAMSTTPNLITGITRQIEDRIATMLRMAVLGQKTPFDLMREMGTIAGKGPWATAFARGEAIYRTEVGRMFSAATSARLDQLSSEEPGWEKQWRSVRDTRTRPTHVRADGQQVPVKEMFWVGDFRARYPHDPTLPAKESVFCFPAGTLVAGRVRGATRRPYAGLLVEVETAGGHRLAGTPNHPILTTTGWVALGDLKEGDDLVSASGLGLAPDVQDVPVPIEQVFGSFAMARVPERIGGSRRDFHGDGTDGEIEVVWPDGELRIGLDPAGAEQFAQSALGWPSLRSGPVAGERGNVPAMVGAVAHTGSGAATEGGVGSAGERPTPGGTDAGHTESVRLGASARHDPRGEQARTDPRAITAEGSGDGLFGHPGQVHGDRIVAVRLREFVGHVFNLDTVDGAYIANGIVAHNCRCVMISIRPEWAGVVKPPYEPTVGKSVDQLFTPDEIAAFAKMPMYDAIKAIVAKAGFDGLPQVFTRAQIEEFAKSGETQWWRGVAPTSDQRGDPMAGSANRFAEGARTGAYRFGSGILGPGTYVAVGESFNYNGRIGDPIRRGGAIDVAREFSGLNGAVTTGSIRADARILRYEFLGREWKSYLDSMAEVDPRLPGALRLIGQDDSTKALLMGYDGYFVANSSISMLLSGDQIVMWNRTAMRFNGDTTPSMADIYDTMTRTGGSWADYRVSFEDAMAFPIPGKLPGQMYPPR